MIQVQAIPAGKQYAGDQWQSSFITECLFVIKDGRLEPPTSGNKWSLAANGIYRHQKVDIVTQDAPSGVIHEWDELFVALLLVKEVNEKWE